MKYLVTFNHVGRGKLIGQTIEFTAAGPSELASKIYYVAAKHLVSKHFDVEVDIEAGKGLIEQGRFGSFTVAVLP